MTKKSKTIVFFGSGPVAAESLELLSKDFTIEAVVTKPRPAHHKGAVPVLQVANDLHLPIYTADSKRSLDKLIERRPFKSSLGILIDFGIIVSQKVIDSFEHGIINSHFSLLPEWRGADPITFSILSGQKKTGVSLMLLTAGMDEGPILGYGEYELPPTITTPDLTHDLILLSYGLLQAIVPKYLDGTVVPQPQNLSMEPTYSRKLTKDDGIIDWRRPADEIERHIRAFAEWPKSRTHIHNLKVIITRAHTLDATGAAGQFVILNKSLVAFCGQKALVIDALKPAGKKEMTGQAFLAGYKHILSED